MSHRTRFNIGSELLRGNTMNELEMRVEVLGEHVARLEGVSDVMLQEAWCQSAECFFALTLTFRVPQQVCDTRHDA